MDEERIGRVMDAFRCGQLECLVATSIIESGIDIPNANTLIVTDASHFGLAELHQIRGRIGRFTRQAHAYFLTPPRREIGEEARERLNAIQEYAELGAGFKLAMRDLELRGAGNLLGAEQSGQIDAIGYELYTKLLGEAVAKAKAQAAAAAGLPPPPPAPVASPALPELGMAVDAYIPDDWLETAALRFDLHRRLDKARRLSDLEAAAHQARDRYGALPAPVARLFLLRAIRLRLPHLGIEKITVEDRQIQLRLKGAFPKELAAVSLPELVHIQPGAGSLVLFLRKQPDQDQALRLLARLFALDLAFLGEGW
jgi:transcription-repair coupling factor (superfamily II helicase)